MQSNPTPILCDTASVEALCQSCGACCATYRVSFYWGETTASPDGWVPSELTEQLNLFQSCMKGSSSNQPRCCALSGEIGERVSCIIYDKRSSTCREYEVFDAEGRLNSRCNEARAKHGLAPLSLRYVEVQQRSD